MGLPIEDLTGHCEWAYHADAVSLWDRSLTGRVFHEWLGLAMLRRTVPFRAAHSVRFRF